MRIKPSHIAAALALVSTLGIAYGAQFWLAYCTTEKKELGSWTSEEKVANINMDYHLRNNPNHSVYVKSK